MSPCPLRGCLDLLLMRFRVFAALATLQKLHKTEGQGSHDQVGHDISDELHQISDQQTLDAQDRTANMFQLVRDKRYRRRMLMGFLMQCMTQSTGILVINNYMVCRPWKHWFGLHHEPCRLTQLDRSFNLPPSVSSGGCHFSSMPS